MERFLSPRKTKPRLQEENSFANVAWQIEKNLPAIERAYRSATGLR
jgi:hypothetical protein